MKNAERHQLLCSTLVLPLLLASGCGTGRLSSGGDRNRGDDDGSQSPAAPHNLDALPGDTKVTLTWTASAGATGYRIYWAVSAGIDETAPDFIEVTDGAEQTATHTGLTNGTRYFYVIAAMDGDSQSSVSAEVDAMPVISTPQNLAAAAGDGEATLTWESVPGATGYRIYWGTATGVDKSVPDLLEVVDGATLTVTHAGLSNGTQYFYVIAALDAGSQSALSIEVRTVPVISTPAGLAAVGGDSEVLLTWDAVAGATGYRLYWSTTTGVDETAPDYLEVADGAQLTVAHTDVAYGTQYFYVIAALDASSQSPVSGEVSATPTIAAPLNLSAVAGDTEVTLSWDAVVGATDYRIFWSTTPGVDETSLDVLDVPGGATVTTTHAGLVNGTSYHYVVAALDASSRSEVSAEASATPIISTPSNFAAVAGGSEVVLSWDAVAGATGYRIFWVTSAGVDQTSSDYLDVPDGATLSVTHTGLTATTEYFYAIAALDAESHSDISAEISARPLVSTPLNLAAAPGDTEVTLSWDAVAGATGYRIFWATSAGVDQTSSDYLDVPDGVTTVVTAHTGLSNGTQYSYVIAAKDDTSQSLVSAEVSATPLISTPQGLTAVAGDTDIALSWSAVAGATGYRVYWATSTGVDETSPDFLDVAGGATVTTNHTGLTNGTQVFYVITAFDAASESGASAEQSAIPVVSTPTNLAAVAEDTEVALSWDAVTGATAYRIFWATTTGVDETSLDFLDVAGGATVTTNHTGLTNGTQYFYVIAAVDATSQSDVSAEVSATPVIATPINFAAVAGNTEVALSWDAVTGATAYRIFWATTTGVDETSLDFLDVAGGATVTTDHTGLTNGTQYFYVIAAIDATTQSAVSAEVSATPIISTPQNLVAVAGDRYIDLTWDPVVGATSYTVYWDTVTGVDQTSVRHLDNISETSYRHGFRPNGTAFFYVVTANDATSQSVPSAEATATAVISTPANLTATAGNSQIVLSWDEVPGAASYAVYWALTTGVDDTSLDFIVGVPTGAYTHDGLANGTEYFYVVTAVDAGSESNISNETSATPVIQAPANLQVAVQDSELILRWDPVPNAASYTLYWQDTSSCAGSPCANAIASPSNPYSHNTVVNGTTYWYVVTATDAGTNESGVSNEVTATPQAPTLPAPTGLAGVAGENENTLTWDSVAGATSYTLYWGAAGGITKLSNQITGIGSTMHVHHGLTEGVAIYYRVAASDAASEGPLSGEIDLTPDFNDNLDPTLTLPAASLYDKSLAAATLPSMVVGGSIVGHLRPDVDWLAVTPTEDGLLTISVSADDPPAMSDLDVSVVHDESNFPFGYGFERTTSSSEALTLPVYATNTYYILIWDFQWCGLEMTYLLDLSFAASGLGAEDDNDVPPLATGIGAVALTGSQDDGTAAGGDRFLVDADATFLTDGVVAGDVLRVASDPNASTGAYPITSVDSETQLTVSTNLDADTAIQYHILRAIGPNATINLQHTVSHEKDADWYAFVPHPDLEYRAQLVPPSTVSYSLYIYERATGDVRWQVFTYSGPDHPPPVGATQGGNMQYETVTQWFNVVGSLKDRPLIDSDFDEPRFYETSETYELVIESSPPPPLNAVATAGPGVGEITITWDAAPGATSYNLYWDDVDGITHSDTVINAVTSPYVHTGLTNAMDHYYRVVAVRDGLQSQGSNEVSATAP